MKIGIIGIGTASAVATMILIETMIKHNRFDDIDLTCIHDPNKPSAHVGESASSQMMVLMANTINFNYLEDIKHFDGMVRWAGKYLWAPANGRDFSVSYPVPGVNLNSVTFGSFVFDRISQIYPNFTMIEDSVDNITQDISSVTVTGSKQTYLFDFIIDCRGNPTKEELESDAYRAPEFTSVNSVILYQDKKNYHEEYTSAYVHDNGWMFGVPLQTRKTFGYLYNNNITSYEEACEDFGKLKGIDATPLRHFSWTPYYKVKALEHRILSMGNRLYFFEPHHNLALHSYTRLMRGFCQRMLFEDNMSMIEEPFNMSYHYDIECIKNLIAINYQGTNSIDSKFWDYARDKAFLQLSNSQHFVNWCRTVKNTGWTNYWEHDGGLMREYCQGFEIDLQKYIL
jgi:hypothetical protein